MKSKRLKYVKITDFVPVVEFLENNFSSPTHWPDWNIVVSKHFNTNFFYFGAYEDGQLIGICPMHEEKKRIIKYYHSGQFHYIPFGGWIFSKPSSIDFADLSIGKFSMMQIFSLPLLNEFNVQITIYTKYFKTLIIDLGGKLEDIWKNQLNYSKRKQIKKAQKTPLSVEAKDYFNHEFFKRYNNACDQFKLNALPWDFFMNLNESVKKIKIKILTASFNDIDLATLVIVWDKNYSFSWLSWIDNYEYKFGQGELLLWEAIRVMHSEKCNYYDLGYIEKEQLPNIYKFKSGFSKKEVDIPYIVVKPLLYKVYNKVASFFKQLQ